MFWTISIILFTLWFVGVATPFTFNGYIHLLLLAAGAVTLIPLLRKKADSRLKAPPQTHFVSPVLTNPAFVFCASNCGRTLRRFSGRSKSLIFASTVRLNKSRIAPYAR